MTTALAVANAFIQLAESNGAPISNMKLQKLAYFAQGFYAAFSDGQALFEDEIEAWKYGPVIPDLYHKFKIYLAGAIPSSHPYREETPLNPRERSVVEWVFKNLGQHSAIKLSDFSHTQGSPWDVVFNGAGTDREITLPDMIPYFKGLLSKPPGQPAVGTVALA
jgi:uncharacterized phage-associated protein